MKKRIIVPAVAAVVLSAGLLYAGSKVSAHGFAYENGDTIVARLAERLGVSEDEVKVVFDELRDEHQQEMEVRFEGRLDQAVADGKITEEQKQLILAKHEELRAQHQQEMEQMQGQTPEERREAMEAHHQEMQQWANENEIDLGLLSAGLVGKSGHMKHGRNFGDEGAL